MVRARRTVPASRSRAVQLLAAHALAAHQPREPPLARQGLARERRDVVRGAGDSREATAIAPAHVHAVPPSRSAPQKPHRRLADGSVPRRRGHPDRLAPRALRRARQGRGRAGDHRDDLRLAGRPHLARLRGSLHARPRSRVDAHRRIRACGDRRQDRHAAGSLRSERVDAARLGGSGCAAGGGQLANHWRISGRVVATQSSAARDDARRHGHRAGRVRAGGDHGQARRLRPDRTALGARLSPVGVHLAPDQPPL